MMLAMIPVRAPLKFHSILSLSLAKGKNKSAFLCFHYNDTTQNGWIVESAITFPCHKGSRSNMKNKVKETPNAPKCIPMWKEQG